MATVGKPVKAERSRWQFEPQDFKVIGHKKITEEEDREDVELIKSITRNPRTTPYIIGVCGRSCSGKSTVVDAVEKSYPDVLVIRQDKFFKRSDSSEIHYWETLECLRNDRLIHAIKMLKEGEPAHIPSRGWTEHFDRVVYPKEYIIVEGYLLFAIKELSDLFDKRVWIDVSDLNILYRRLKRDGDLKYIEKIMDPVIYQSKQYEPVQRSRADIIIDGNASKDIVVEEFKRLVFG